MSPIHPSTQAARHDSHQPMSAGAWLGSLLLALALIALTVLGATAAQAAAEKPFPAVALPGKVRGEAAVQALGAKLPEVAAWYGMTSAQFAAMLRGDPHAWLDRSGRLLFIDAHPPLPEGAEATGSGGLEAAAPFPLEETFRLHSRPGAKRTIYLDFDGHVSTGTAWNTYFNLSTIDAKPFDLDGDPLSFNATERERIQQIWQRVAEDFAPFDVDVTTEEPPADRLTRSGSGDEIYGTRVVVTRDWTTLSASPCNCGGIAYVGVFNATTESYKPAWVFYDRLGNGNEKYVAEAASHEAGHNLGLSHDGVSGGSAYYAGHGSGATGWAPIMGVGYYKELTQWSAGEYPNASNTQDDLARIPQYGAPLRHDDHGDSPPQATPLVQTPVANGVALAGAGVISTRTDVDYFSMHVGAGALTLTVTPAARGANLDMGVELYDANGLLVAAANPVEALGASISLPALAGGTYFLKIDGVGKGDLATGYSDYGSLGQYNVSGTASASTNQPPVAQAGATPTQGTAPLTVNFTSAGSHDPDGGPLAYSWDFGDGSVVSTVPDPTHVYAVAGEYLARLTVTDAGGAVATAALPISVAAPARVIRVERIDLALAGNRNNTRAVATVTMTDTAGQAVAGATVTGSWSGLVSGSASGTTATNGTVKFNSPSTRSRGTFTFTVTGVSLAGAVYDSAQNKETSDSIVY